MAQKATHRGHCQWCDRVQMLPGDLLAKHGYEVKHRGQGGFFSGTCPGSKELPFEKSRDLVLTSIVNAESALRFLHEEVDALRATDPASTNKAWLHVYHPELSSRTKGSVYLWELLELEQVDGRVRCVNQTSRIRSLYWYKPMVEVVRDGLIGRIAWKQSRVNELLNYVAQQKRRAEKWVPDAPLLPLA